MAVRPGLEGEDANEPNPFSLPTFRSDDPFTTIDPVADQEATRKPQDPEKTVAYLPIADESSTQDNKGNSHKEFTSMSSPLYDAATGKGVDRIQSKDIVALMDHLTVRDAQRKARDTEILVTLVRSAAEMRNQLEDMKKFIREQDELIGPQSNSPAPTAEHAITAPEPLPSEASSVQGTEIETKRKNIFKRALKGLGANNAGDLASIEKMLEQLLSEVDLLRDTTSQKPVADQLGGKALPTIPEDDKYGHAYEYERQNIYENDYGYEPEGVAGTRLRGLDNNTLTKPATLAPERHRSRSSEQEEGTETMVKDTQEMSRDRITRRVKEKPQQMPMDSSSSDVKKVRTSREPGSIPTPFPDVMEDEFIYGKRYPSTDPVEGTLDSQDLSLVTNNSGQCVESFPSAHNQSNS